MAAIGTCWASGSWVDDAWIEGSWGSTVAPVVTRHAGGIEYADEDDWAPAPREKKAPARRPKPREPQPTIRVRKGPRRSSHSIEHILDEVIHVARSAPPQVPAAERWTEEDERREMSEILSLVGKGAP